jgi:hypothetical protein
MFERREVRTLPTGDLWGTIGPLQETLFRAGAIATQAAGPGLWIGKSPQKPYGYVIKATIKAFPGPNGLTVDLKLEAELEDKGIALLYGGWLICFPVAAIFFLLAYQECRQAQIALYNESWAALPYCLPTSTAFGS